LSLPRRRRELAAWLLATLAISAAFARLAAHNLGNYRPVSNDEVELIAVGYKLATQGIFGSDMYAGFFGGDQHHLETLPLQPILDAISFRFVGAGVLQARWVSLMAGTATVWVTGWLANRWYGLGAAVIAELLLAFWPSNLTAASNGLPLLGIARTARYDVVAVATVWLAIALLDATLRKPHPARAVALGLSLGLAALSQFFGSFAVLVVLAAWAGTRLRQRGATLVWITLGAMFVLAPYIGYVWRYRSDLAGQLSVYGTRGDFLRPTFYVENALSEWTRYAHLLPGATATPAPLSEWLVLAGVWPALGYVVWRARQPWRTGDRLLLLSLGTFVATLGLLDQTKVPLYAALILPAICICIAAASSAALQFGCRALRAVRAPAASGARVWVALGAVAGGTIAAAVIGVSLDAVAAYQIDFADANRVTPYLALGQRIDGTMPAGAQVLGPERWWWPLREHPYLSLRSIWFQWAAAATAAGPSAAPRFTDWVTRAGAESVVVNINIRADIHAFPEALQSQFWTFIDQCTTQVADFNDPNYFEIEVYEIVRPASDACI
jgi:hypothetical protein